MVHMKFAIENEKQNRMYFFDIQIINEEKQFTVSCNWKPTLCGVYTYFESFLLSTYKFIFSTHSALDACSNWTKLLITFFK